ncbi:MAG: hypothetical protein Q8Q02_07465 [Nocardioides sp.]|nr:hypothetical protein [Nocardioides sp.]
MTSPLPTSLPWPLDGDADLRDRLVAAYREPHRGYHDERHLAEVLAHLDLLLEVHPVHDPLAVRLAAWFHDAVYAGRAGEDEEASAQWAETTLAELVPDETRAEVARLVRLTASHDPAPDDLPGAVLSDADLAVLAADPERYADYRRGVRHEYAAVPADLFSAGRSAVLESLLAAPALFRTATGRARWEDRARANVAAELTALAAVRP